MILKNCTNFISDLTTWILLQTTTNKWTCCSNADFKVLYDQNQPFCLQPCSGPGGCANTDWVGDNYCDDGNNNLECNFDGGDCCPPHANANWNQYCQACDCLKPTTTTTTTPSPGGCNPAWVGDNYCDDVCNDNENNHDDGDCCAPHAVTDWDKWCQTCECLQPTTPTTPPGGCNPAWVGDNYCDDVCNDNENNYDDGDCCAPHAVTDWDKYCQACECRVCRTDSCLCEDNWPKKKCSKKCNAKKCKKSKACKTNCKESCNLCGVVEPCEDQKSSKYCNKQKKKGKCNKSSVKQKCKKTCDACYTN